MKLLFDQNISYKIMKLLPEHIISGSATISDVGLMNASDIEIWQYAKENNFTIVTQDSDFNDINALLGFPPKIIWIRSGNIKTSFIASLIKDNMEEIESFCNDANFGCMEIVNWQPQKG